MTPKIIQRSPGSWTFQLDLPPDPSNPTKRNRKTFTVKGSRKDAERRMRDILHAVERNEFLQPSRITVGEYAVDWIRGYADVQCSPRTAEGYRMILERHLIPSLGSIPLSELQPRHIREYLAAKLKSGRRDGKGGLSKRTVRHHYRLLFEVVEHARIERLVSRNVVAEVKAPRPDYQEMAVLSREELARFLRAAHETEYYAIFMAFALTGCRRSELLGLHWRDIDLQAGTISIQRSLHQLWGAEIVEARTKSKRSRRPVAIGNDLAMILKNYRERREAEAEFLGQRLKVDDPVFCRPDGEIIRPSYVTKAFKRIARSVGLPEAATLRTLRHSHASILLALGANVKEVSERLGHHSAAFTLDVYGHVLPGRQKVAALKFEELLKED